MKHIAAFALLASSVASAGSLAVFEHHGFEIASLEPERSVVAPSTPLLMSLPPVDGFAPNVNVTIQPFGDGMDSYIELSRKQFGALGLSVIQDAKTANGEWVAEYAGPFQKMRLHWYCRAVLNGTQVYLVTATAPETEWEALGEKMKAVVDSFRIRK